MPEIAYPVAYKLPYTIFHIEEAYRGDYLCLQCNNRMVVHRGPTGKKRDHFQHYRRPDFCDPDGALHKTAQALVIKAFLKAQEEGDEYNVEISQHKCCGKITTVNIAQEGSTIASERTVIRGTRSDLVILKESQDPRVIIEIVVTHDMSPETRDKYLKSGTPVITIKDIDWDTVSILNHKIWASSFINIEQKAFCRDCYANHLQSEKRRRDAEQRRRQETAKTLQVFNEKKEEAEKLVGLQRSPKHPRLKEITEVGIDGNLTNATRKTSLRPDTKARLNQQARDLASVGFIQQGSRPTLFVYKAGKRKIYADLDSTEVIIAWERKAPAIYSFRGPGCRECVIQEVQRKLKSFNIPSDRHFEDQEGHDHDLPVVHTEHRDCRNQSPVGKAKSKNDSTISRIT